MSLLMPLTDVTNHSNVQRGSTKANEVSVVPISTAAAASTASSHFLSSSDLSLLSLLHAPVPRPATVSSKFRHDPYNWPFVADHRGVDSPTADDVADDEVPCGVTVCVAVVQHKCHVSECISGFMLGNGQYVVVRGDRGIDVGVVVRVHTNLSGLATLPSIGVLRYATQQEVDFWATDLKAMEASALEYCRQRVQRHRLPMDVRHAEYQFDQKKLTFYFDARQRVDFVMVLRELYREFGCRIWMEKV